MEDLGNTISQILGDPESMSQIMSLAQSLGVGSPPEPEHPAPQTDLSLLSDFPIQSMMELIQQAGSVDQREAQLLNALKSYCSTERQHRIDRALRIARISQIAGAALRSLNKKE